MSTTASPIVAPASEKEAVDPEIGSAAPTEENSASEEDSDSASSDEGGFGKFGPHRLWWRTRRARTGCAIIAILAVAFITFLGFPRMPTWEMQSVTFDPNMMGQLASAFTDPKFNDTIVFPLNATVKVWNPNFLAGASVGEGHYDVSYENLKIGTAISLPMYSPHHAECISEAVTESILSPELMNLMMSQLTPDLRFKKRPKVLGTVPVKVWGLIPLTVHLECSVEVYPMDLMTAPPGKVVHDHDCTYRIR